MKRMSILLALIGGAAFAREPDPAAVQCTDRRVDNPEHVIAACTDLIGSNGLDQKTRATAYFNRGNAYQRTGQSRLALADFDEAIRLDAKMSDAFRRRADVRTFANINAAGASADYDEAIRLNPRDVTAFGNRAMLKGLVTPGAMADLDQAIRIDPRQATYFYNRGYAHASRNDHARAIEDFSQAIRLVPSDELYIRTRGSSYEKIGDDARAITDFSTAIRLAPAVPISYYKRGLAYARRHEPARALTDLRAFVRLLPDDKEGRAQFCRVAAPVQPPPEDMGTICDRR